MSRPLSMERVVSICKQRGFVFPSSEIYGGLANSWDYGPLGAELKHNIKQVWWKCFVHRSPYNIGLDSAILMNPQVWRTSGHVDSFSDPLIDCRGCKSRFRADKLIEEKLEGGRTYSSLNASQLESVIKNLRCPRCGASDFTNPRQFNLMFKTFVGVTEDSLSTVYLRPETAQGVFVNFRHLLRVNRNRFPFGVGQIGKAFRNEITPGNFIFRTREFEQMELEFFCEPGTDEEWYKYWQEFCINWLLDLGIAEENLRLRPHSKEELSHYSKATSDIEFRFPFGWGELWGIANRTDFDLRMHAQATGQDFTYTDVRTGKRYMPYCIEPSVGVDRLFLAFLCNGFVEEDVGEDTRVVLRLHPELSPFKAAVLPLSRTLREPALEIYQDLSRFFSVDYDETGSIGKRYRRQDEIGTPYCITFDFDSLHDHKVTIRDRDTMQQIRIDVSQVKEWIQGKIDTALLR